MKNEKEHAQLLADKIQPLLGLIDILANDLEQEDIDLLIESKKTLLNHINMQESAITLTMAFGFTPDTTEEKFKAKTLEVLVELIKVRKEYRTALIKKEEDQIKLEQNRAEIMRLFGNL